MANTRNKGSETTGVSNEVPGQDQQPNLEVAAANGFSLLNTPFMLAVRDAFRSGKVAFDTVISSGGGDLSDFWDTFIRLLQVGGNVAQNGTNDASTENPNSPFYKWFYQDGPGSNFNLTGSIVFGVGGLVFVTGTVIKIFKDYRKIVLGTYDYLLRQLNQLSTKEYTREDVMTGINDLITRGKVSAQLVRPENRPHSQPSNGIQSVTDFINAFDAKKNAIKKYHDVEPSIGEKILGTITLVAKKTYNFICNTAFVYWVIWFPFVLAAGIAAASSAVIWGPTVLAATLGTMTLFTLWKAVNRIRKASLTPEQAAERAENKKLQAEEQRMLDEAKTRFFLKQDHAAKKALFSSVITASKEQRLYALKHKLDKVGKLDTTEKYVDETSQKKISLLRNRLYAAAAEVAPQDLSPIKTTENEVRQSRLAKYLLAGVKRRAAVNVFLEAASGIITASFMFWIVGTVAAFIPGVIAKAVAVFCDSGFATAIAGGTLGALFGIKRIAELVREQKEYRQQVEQTLMRRYKNTDQSILQTYESLELDIEYQKARVQLLRLENLNKLAKDNRLLHIKNNRLSSAREICFGNAAEPRRLDKYRKMNQVLAKHVAALQKQLEEKGIKIPEHQLLSQYHINGKRSVDNDYYFAKQKEQPSVGTRVKKFLSRAYTFVCGMQSGVFIARTLFLAGAVFGGICLGAPPLFFAVAGVLAITIAATRIARFISERERAKRVAFISNIDTRISFMRKQKKELQVCEQILNPEHIAPYEIDAPLPRESSQITQSNGQSVVPETDVEVILPQSPQLPRQYRRTSSLTLFNPGSQAAPISSPGNADSHTTRPRASSLNS